MSKKNAILVDFDVKEPWIFQIALEETIGGSWEIVSLTSNRNHGEVIQNLIRYIKYFLLPMRIFLKRKAYKTVLAWQQFYGLILAFYFGLFRIKNAPDITVMTFIYKEKASWLGKVYFRFIHFILHSGYISRVIVFSKDEITYYSQLFGVPESLFAFVELGVEDERDRLKAHISNGDYYVSAGRSNRDYSFLVDAWKNQGTQLKIICDAFSCNSADNIRVLGNCFGDDYLKEIAGCKAVIVPLKDENISSGQLVALHAMMFGKPLIVTKGTSLNQYVIEKENGIYMEKTAESMNEAISYLQDPAACEMMGASARRMFEERHSLSKMAEKIGEIICPKNSTAP